MNTPFLPIALAIFGGALYHVSQKSVPKNVSPFSAIMFAYAVGIVLCLGGLWLDPARRPVLISLKESNWAVIGIGVGAAIIEIAFLLAYRSGWDISTASVVTNISVALILIPIGLIAFKEHLSARSAAGIAFCLIGLYLISKK